MKNLNSVLSTNNIILTIILFGLTYESLIKGMEQTNKKAASLYIKHSEQVDMMAIQVNHIVNTIKSLRSKIATIDPAKNDAAVQKAVSEIAALIEPIENMHDFIQQNIKDDPDFNNKLSSDGMPPRIIEEILSLNFRHELDSIQQILDVGHNHIIAHDEADYYERNHSINYFIWKLQDEESKISQMVEDYTTDTILEHRSGLVLRFKNVQDQYSEYFDFFAENKKYTQEEAHVIMHLATYVIQTKEALELSEKDDGRYLYNLLKTYADWLPEGTHTSHDTRIVKMHGSLMGIADKNNKTMLDYTNELINQIQTRRSIMKIKKSSILYMDQSLQELNEITFALKGFRRNPETGEVTKIPTRTLWADKSLSSEYNPWEMGEEEQSRIASIKGLGLETTTRKTLNALQEVPETNKPEPLDEGLIKKLDLVINSTSHQSANSLTAKV